MANPKSPRRPRRRRQRQAHNKDAETRRAKPKSIPKQNAQANKDGGELPQAFIYTYTIYKALE